jgi:hypothetical protein
VRRLLIHPRVNPGDEQNKALQVACERGHIDVVNLLLSDSRVNPSDKENLAIQCASKKGHVEIVKLLLADSRVDPSDKNNEAIRFASQKGKEIVKLLLQDKRVDPSADDQMLLLRCLRLENVEMVRLLLTDPRIVCTNMILNRASVRSVEALFAAAHPRFWPRAIGNDVVCLQRGPLRRKLDNLEAKSAWILMLCVGRKLAPWLTSEIGGVLLDLQLEWLVFGNK